MRRGLTGVKRVISDAHEGLKAAIIRVLGATWQRCRVHAMRNALAYVPKGQHTMVAAAIRQAFLQPDHDNAVQTWRHVADQRRARWSKLGSFMDDAEADVLASMAFPAQHRTKLHSTDDIDKRFASSCAKISGHGRPRGEERRLRMRAPPRSLHSRSSFAASVHRFGPLGRQCRTINSYARSACSAEAFSRSRSSLTL